MDQRMLVADLCAGIGGFSLGLRAAGVNSRTVVYVEREAFCCAVLAQQMQSGRLDAAPVWTDLRTFDGRPWRSVVDLVTAGFPCQPWSQAGKRKGEADERWLWDDIARIVGEIQPGAVFLENVTLDAFRRPRADLEDLGFRVPPAVQIAAADLGAPHLRERFFVLAHADPALRTQQGWPEPGWPGASEPRADGTTGAATHADGPRRSQRLGTIPRTAPFSSSQRRSPWAIEPCPEPTVRRMDDGAADRVDRLRALGNAVIPACVAAAWQALTCAASSAAR